MDPISDPPTQRSSRPVHALPEELGKPLEDSLDHIVSNSKAVRGDRKDQLAHRKASQLRADAVHSHGPEAKHWIASFFSSEETLDHNSYMSYSSVEKLLREESIKQGQTYDQTGPDVEEHIKSFIKTYDLPLDELLVKDLSQYPTFNSFFSRRLLPTARPITSVGDPTITVSAADCRLTVYQTVDQAKEFWIKGQQFTLPNLLIGNDVADTRFKAIQEDNAAALAIHRLAPQDYHRFHSPVEGVIGAIKDIDGELYTVNPQAINENLNVFTMNKRSVMLIHANLGSGRESVPIAFVAIGAMLVGSIGWSKKPGDKVCKGEELGWFQYGGSTTITVFPKSAGVEFDSDLVENSKKKMETLVRVGMEIGKCSTAVK
ncbi:phosphatidylserine decarboxylase [Cryptococcus gattii VGV]|nr:phosphatidylserine decarboxylase [Cryptococcus gattii VGV]